MHVSLNSRTLQVTRQLNATFNFQCRAFHVAPGNLVEFHFLFSMHVSLNSRLSQITRGLEKMLLLISDININLDFQYQVSQVVLDISLNFIFYFQRTYLEIVEIFQIEN